MGPSPLVLLLLLSSCSGPVLEPPDRGPDVGDVPGRIDEMRRVLERIDWLRLEARRYDALDDCLDRKIPATESLYQAKVGVETCRTVARDLR